MCSIQGADQIFSFGLAGDQAVTDSGRCRKLTLDLANYGLHPHGWSPFFVLEVCSDGASVKAGDRPAKEDNLQGSVRMAKGRI